MSLHVMLGESTSDRVTELLARRGWGRMWVFRNIRPLEGERWGFDTGIFQAWDRESAMVPAQFDGDAYLRRVERAHNAGAPWLATVPDLIAAGERSLEFSMAWLPRMPRDWPLYLAVQDGMTPEMVAPIVAPFAGIFLGGSDRFKATAPMWCAWAHERGMRFHYARCSTPKRLQWCMAFGADSTDSTQPLWTWAKLEAYERANVGAQQREMFDGDDNDQQGV